MAFTMFFLDDDAVAVQYQFVFVANVIWNFGLDDLKPLSMFNTQEANMFFQVKKTSQHWKKLHLEEKLQIN